MLGLLIAAAAGTAAPPAADCPVAIEAPRAAELRLHPACPLAFARSHAAVREALARAGSEGRVRLYLGRLIEHPWLSESLARQASASRQWDLAAGQPLEGGTDAYVAAALRGMPEFGVLFDAWRISAVEVGRVLLRPAAKLRLAEGAPVPPDAMLPFDAMVWVTLERQ